MKSKKEFEQAVKIVKEAIHRIDPYCLIASGCPDDEFDSEILSVISQLSRCKSGRDVSHAIARVLNSSFNEKFEPNSFEVEGNLIFNQLKAKGLVE